MAVVRLGVQNMFTSRPSGLAIAMVQDYKHDSSFPWKDSTLTVQSTNKLKTVEDSSTLNSSQLFLASCIAFPSCLDFEEESQSTLILLLFLSKAWKRDTDHMDTSSDDRQDPSRKRWKHSKY